MFTRISIVASTEQVQMLPTVHSPLNGTISLNRQNIQGCETECCHDSPTRDQLASRAFVVHRRPLR